MRLWGRDGNGKELTDCGMGWAGIGEKELNCGWSQRALKDEENLDVRQIPETQRAREDVIIGDGQRGESEREALRELSEI